MAARWDEAKAAVMGREPCKYKLTLDPDTHLLAEYLCAAFHEAVDAGVGSALAWYRVAERAKELRA